MNAQPKLYLNMILKEDEPADIVKRSIDSIKNYVDGMYIAVTYKKNSPKKSSALLKLLAKYGVNVYFFKWVYDFSKARQFVMDKTPKGPTNFIYWQDADDVLVGGEHFRTILHDMVRLNQAGTFLTYLYNVELTPEGDIHQVLVEHKRERIVRNDNTWEWKGMLHETLISQKQDNVAAFFREEAKVVHLSSPDRADEAIDRNIDILEKQAEAEQHRDPRTLIYLAKGYYDKSRMVEDPKQRNIYAKLALSLFNEYLQGDGNPGDPGYQTPSGWAEERAQAWSYVGEIAFQAEAYAPAEEAYQKAIDEYPYLPLYYINLAMVYCQMEDYKKAKHWLTLASTIDMPDTAHIVMPRDFKTRALEVSFNINYHEQNFEAAERDIRMLQEIMPRKEWDDRLITVQSLGAARKAMQSITFLGKYLEQIKEKDKLQHLVQAIPNDLKTERFAAEMRHLFLPPRKWGKNEIAILCGPGFEQWSPKSAERGVGGSEEAVINLGRMLALEGWKVTVYANPGNEAGLHDGVDYQPYYDINLKDEFNVLVLWRSVGFVDFNPKAEFTLLWLHDVPNNPDFTPERVAKLDKIAVLSDYHESILRMVDEKGNMVPVPKHKIFNTANGIQTMPEFDVERDPYRMIYSSSLDRGVVYLLANWDKIRAEVPEANLHIYYGWDLYDAIHKDNPGKMKEKEYMQKLMAKPGIHFHGRIGHHKLHEEFSKAGIWAYPTDFTEISCITGMKAQALGAIPVCTTLAALDETVKNGIKVDVDIQMEEGQEEYVKSLVSVLKDHKLQEEIRPNMMKWARKYYAWGNIAAAWSTLFKNNIQDSDRTPVLAPDLEGSENNGDTTRDGVSA
jgi:glycosyltransferase involved in cell wall biosynthesis